MGFHRFIAAGIASLCSIAPVHAQTLPPATVVQAPLAAPEVDPVIARAIAHISPDRLRAIDARLVAFGTRSTFSERAGGQRGASAARPWIAGKFRAIARQHGGRLTIAFDSYLKAARTTLAWTAVPRAAGYEIVRRASTDGDWTSATNVGDVTTVTVPFSKDNWLFGMRAVDARGQRSVVTFPLPRCS